MQKAADGLWYGKSGSFYLSIAMQALGMREKVRGLIQLR
jgi:hypothetical protein